MNRGERRKKDFAKAIRKQKLDNSFSSSEGYRLYNNLHQYSKNKIHCSCGLCMAKTKNKGKKRRVHGNYYPSYNPPIRDVKKIEFMNYEDV